MIQVTSVCAFDLDNNYMKIIEIANKAKKNLKFICCATDIIRVYMLYK